MYQKDMRLFFCPKLEKEIFDYEDRKGSSNNKQQNKWRFHLDVIFWRKEKEVSTGFMRYGNDDESDDHNLLCGRNRYFGSYTAA